MRILLFVIIMLFMFSCSREHKLVVLLEDLHRLEIEGDRLSVILLKSYPNKAKCNGALPNANLYLCTETETGDTLLVFEICKIIPDFAKNDYKGERDITVEKESVMSQDLKSVIVDIPDSTIVKRGSRYILSSLTRLEY